MLASILKIDKITFEGASVETINIGPLDSPPPARIRKGRIDNMGTAEFDVFIPEKDRTKEALKRLSRHFLIVGPQRLELVFTFMIHLSTPLR